MPSLFRRIYARSKGALERRSQRASLEIPVGGVLLGDLRTTAPISAVFGLDRGNPIDRYYIETFLQKNADAICGTVLEVADATYTKKYGGSNVTQSEVLHLTGESPETTIIADLTNAMGIDSNTFDCIILTEVMQFIFETDKALAEIYRILKPGGTVLCTLPGISQISRFDMERWGDYWRFTTCSANRLFENIFPVSQVEVESYGNVLSSIAFLEGLAQSELTKEELDFNDPDYQLKICIRAQKEYA